MRTLLLLRHAKSSWADPTLPDHERPLAPRGRRDAKRMSKYLRRRGQKPELIICSPAARTQETQTLMRPALGAATVLLEDGLYGASHDGLLARIRRVADTVTPVMLIGHNPGLHELALDPASTGDDLPRLQEKFPTAAGTLTIADGWEQLAPASALLAAFVVPKDLS